MKQHNVSLDRLHLVTQSFAAWVQSHEFGFISEEMKAFRTMVDHAIVESDFLKRLEVMCSDIRLLLQGVWSRTKVAGESSTWRRRKNPRNIVLTQFPDHLKEFLSSLEGFDPKLSIQQNPEDPKTPEELQKDIIDQLTFLFRSSETENEEE